MLSSASIDKSSSGAPASHTGAPGENSCAASGCHDDNKPNDGSASLQIEVGAREKENRFWFIDLPGFSTIKVPTKINEKPVFYWFLNDYLLVA